MRRPDHSDHARGAFAVHSGRVACREKRMHRPPGALLLILVSAATARLRGMRPRCAELRSFARWAREHGARFACSFQIRTWPSVSSRGVVVARSGFEVPSMDDAAKKLATVIP
jgi:hypothetical protein